MKKIRVAIINSYNNGSTGKIASSIGDIASNDGIDVIKCYPKHSSNISQKKDKDFLFGNPFFYSINYYLTMLTGKHGCYQWHNTKKLINKLKDFKPDIIHLHNLHSSYVNLKMLFEYIKNYDIKVIWTLHDCWAFTGHCPYFTIAKCDKWKTGCYKCPQYKDYPKCLFDNSKKMYRLKKELFTGVENLTIVTPSEWLAGLVKQSFLKDYPVKVINNGIDLNVFKPTESDFRKKYNIPEGKFILLGVAFGWGKRKGLDVFIELEKRLDSAKYQIVLVGTDDNADKRLPSGIISIHRTQNQTELAEIYTAADLFVNPTREEVLGMVNIEANACGTPVITFDTGGSPECINEKSGMVVNCGNVNDLQKEIERIQEKMPFSKEGCVLRAMQFNENRKFSEYVNLYKGENS